MSGVGCYDPDNWSVGWVYGDGFGVGYRTGQSRERLALVLLGCGLRDVGCMVQQTTCGNWCGKYCADGGRVGTSLDRDPACTRCPLHASAKTVCVWGEGHSPCDILFVGEAPGKEEDLSGRPFMGKGGKLLRGTLDALQADLGLDHIAVRYTTAARCRPPKSRTPKFGELVACRPFLYHEIQETTPKLLVMVGTAAGYALVGSKMVLKEDRHKVWWVDVGNRKPPVSRARMLLPAVLVYSPDAVLRNPALAPYFSEDIEACLTSPILQP